MSGKEFFLKERWVKKGPFLLFLFGVLDVRACHIQLLQPFWDHEEKTERILERAIQCSYSTEPLNQPWGMHISKPHFK